MNERTLSDFSTIAFTSCWAGDLYQSFACATLSNDDNEPLGRIPHQRRNFVASSEELTSAGLYRRTSFRKQLFEEVGINNFTDFDYCIGARRLCLCL